MKQKLSVVEQYAIEQKIRLLERIVYAPTRKAHSIAVALLKVLNNKLEEDKK